MEVPGDTHYVFVCQGKNCLTKGSAELLGQIRTALGGQQTFKVVPFICFGACTASPNIAVFPDRLWYSMVMPEQQSCVIQSILKRRGNIRAISKRQQRSQGTCFPDVKKTFWYVTTDC